MWPQWRVLRAFDRATRRCPADCGAAAGRGTCVNGACFCAAGYHGYDCGAKGCPSDCHGNGKCVDGRCACSKGFEGTSCAEADVPADATALAAGSGAGGAALVRHARRLKGGGTAKLAKEECSLRCAAGCGKASCATGRGDGCYSACVLQCVPECLERIGAARK